MADADDTSLKRCSKCDEDKPKSEFHKKRGGKDGLCQMCKGCNCAHAKRWRDADPEHAKKRQQANYQKHRLARNARSREYRQENIDAVRAYDKLRREKVTKEQVHLAYMRRRDKAIASNKAWAAKNRELASAAKKRWRMANTADVNRWDAARRAMEKNATPAWANGFFIAEAYRLAKLREQVCGGKWHVDHIVPLQSSRVCGLHVEHNLQVIPATHNIVKSNRHWPDMP